jgi:nucleotide-binding universal stress UspA family protein
MAAAETLFRDAIGMRNRVEWRQAMATPSAFICEQGRAADLVIVGRQGPDDATPGDLAASPGDLVMQCGRPVLIVPPTSHGRSMERVLVAWKNTREARRAVWDSLPLLARAEEVLVVAVGAESQKAGVVDVVTHLARHGIAAEPLLRTRQDSGDTADELLELAEDWEADLVVCGAYGHSRLREWIFGGVTRDMLNRSPVPCLMSH